MKLNFSIKEVQAITGARLIAGRSGVTAVIHKIIIDSRSPLVEESTLFVLLKGNKTDGHSFVNEFLKKGGNVVLTDHELEDKSVNQLVVDDALKALQELARSHRQKFNIPVIGVTGSNGKTTVKEWLYHVLKHNYKIVRSPKSYNSQIGVALSVLELNESHTLGIFEAGISKPGEMANLQRMIEPNIGIFTGIGDAHNSGFNTENPEEEKKREKYLLFKDTAVILSKEKDGSFHVKNGDKKEVYGSTAGTNGFLLSSDRNNVVYESAYRNNASISNATLTVLTARFLGLKEEVIRKAIRTLPAISMRLETSSGKSNNLLINDAYNLDEKSLEIGLQYLNAHKGGKTPVLILAERKDLPPSESLLSALDEMLGQISVNKVIYIGNTSASEGRTFIDRKYNTVDDFLADPVSLTNSAILFTGSRSCHLETVVNYFTEKKHITQLRINLAAVRKNLNIYRDVIGPKTNILAMVKAQSYGGGIVEMARFLAGEKITYFGVAYADEGVALRNGGIETPILVMNPEPAAFNDIIDFNLEPSIYSLEQLNAFIHQLILKRKMGFPIHIKLDTGMNRLGFRGEQLDELLATLAAQPEVYVRSVFSHFAVADEKEENEYTHDQIRRFEDLCTKIQNALGYRFIKHMANSAGAINYPNAHFDMVRLGIGLFGLLDKENTAGFENVLSLHSQISQVRFIKAGESVGYGRVFKAKSDTKIGIVPVGYADGLRRGLSNKKWFVRIGEKNHPIIGNICMDMCMIDLEDASVKSGDEVQLFGEGNDVFEMSKKLDTIPYEVISSISTRVQRIYLEE